MPRSEHPRQSGAKLSMPRKYHFQNGGKKVQVILSVFPLDLVLTGKQYTQAYHWFTRGRTWHPASNTGRWGKSEGNTHVNSSEGQ